MSDMISNRSMPASTVIPQLPYAGVGPASEWLHRAFGFSVRVRIADHRIQMNAGDGAVVITQANIAPSRASLMVRVTDVDAHHARAAAFGAQIVAPPQTHPYGERQYSVIDCGGHAWTFSQSVADVAPEDWGGTSGQL
jgi:uncharacterized glyoxalase superfamily protein PhnB